jgi:hypothetical protein
MTNVAVATVTCAVVFVFAFFVAFVGFVFGIVIDRLSNNRITTIH